MRLAGRWYGGGRVDEKDPEDARASLETQHGRFWRGGCVDGDAGRGKGVTAPAQRGLASTAPHCPPQDVYLIDNVTVATYSKETAAEAAEVAGLVAPVTNSDKSEAAAETAAEAAAAALTASAAATTWLILVPPWAAVLGKASGAGLARTPT